MPDLITHTTAAYFLSRHRTFERFRVLFYLGTILPDILARPLHILFPQYYSYSIAIHTPIFLLLFTLLCGELFQTSIKKQVMTYLGAGIMLHFILDLFQKHIDAGYYWFFPFSWMSFEIGLFWPEVPVSLIPLWCVLIVITEVITRVRKVSASNAP